MGREERIAEIRTALSNVEAQIAATEAALRTADSVDQVARLEDELTSLKASRTELGLELNNLEATGVEIDGRP